MKKYTEPEMTLLLFDEEEVIMLSTQVSPPISKTYAARELNDVLIGDSVGMHGTTTITIEKIQISN